MGLQTEPELRTVAEVQAQAELRVRRDVPTVVDDLGDPAKFRRDPTPIFSDRRGHDDRRDLVELLGSVEVSGDGL